MPATFGGFFGKSGKTVKFYKPMSQVHGCQAILLAGIVHTFIRSLIFNEFHSGTLGLNISNHPSD